MFTAALETYTLSGIYERRITFCDAGAMSALPSIADMCSATRNVRFVPIADIYRPRELSKWKKAAR